jgi:uncharacterized protein YceH (UPF0502 family)
VDADAVEIRVLGCLIEKQRTTPDAYPLSLNSLRLACNQATNRDPVVACEEREIKAALDRMSTRGWTRFASGASSRALKYRHLLDEALQLSGPELSLLAVLMLRGAQTVGELKQRSERLHGFESIAQVAETLDALSERELVAPLARRPGQKEERWLQLLGGATERTAEPEPRLEEPQPRGDDRVADIEARLERLERAFDDLLSRLDNVPDRE